MNEIRVQAGRGEILGPATAPRPADDTPPGTDDAPETARRERLRSARRPAPDPRVQMLLVLLVSAGVFSPAGGSIVLPSLLLALALTLHGRYFRRAAVIAAVVLGGWAAARILLHLGSPTLAALTVMPMDYLARYGVAAALGMHLFSTTSPSRLHAALRSLRLPRALAVPLVVMVRFLPVVVAEAHAVLDAMRLRGLTRPTTILRHPLLVIERFTVPMIAASLRAGDDLSSAALLRGLGSLTVPTAMDPPRFRPADAAWLTLGLLLLGGALLLPPTMVGAL